jgi:hypothetical protein
MDLKKIEWEYDCGHTQEKTGVPSKFTQEMTERAKHILDEYDKAKTEKPVETLQRK